MSHLILLLEIFVLTVFINYLLSFFWKTKSLNLLLGISLLFLIFFLSNWFGLPVLSTIANAIKAIAVLAFVIVFQPEIRQILSKINIKPKIKKITDFDKFLDQLANSVYRLADKRIGALIAIEHDDSLEEFAKHAVILNADFSSELLETIFSTRTPLHDGAVTIKDKIIVAAAVILPLTDDTSQIAKSIGTRHRAGLGLSYVTDALVIIVSEESGKVSIAREGIITKGIKIDRFKGVVRSIFNPPAAIFNRKKFNLLEWIRQ